MKKNYIFKSQRLGFRNWIDSDVEKMSKINSDKDVMAFFPNVQSENKTLNFINRMKKQYLEKRYCYFAVDKLIDGDFIGFIGLSEQTFKSDFTPCIDIGWRIDKNKWNNGFATEGALRCLEFASDELKLDHIYATAPKVNIKSELIMKKIGMNRIKTFNHPLLFQNNRLKECVLYRIKLN